MKMTLWTLSEGSVQHPGVDPYQYEPYLSYSGEDRGSEGDGTGSNEADEGSEILGNSKWLVASYSHVDMHISFISLCVYKLRQYIQVLMWREMCCNA